jgi:5'-AMP-activated protein kinase, regulatory gamma subunit
LSEIKKPHLIKMNMAVDNDIEGSVFKENVLSLSDCKSAIQSVFSGTSCYDLIQQSAKIVVFETTIPCHMAFYALVEHDTNVAPIWDQERHSLVALMTVSDYIRALRLCNAQNVSMLEFQQKSIAEVMKSTGKFALEHPEFSPLDAEDSIQMMCHYFNRTQYDYVPVVNPDDGSLLSVLGYVDVLHLLNEAAKQHPEYFEVTLGQMGVRVETGAHTAMATSMLRDVLGFGDGDNSIGTGKYIQPAVPILNADGTVLGIYHKTDVAFVSVKAADPESVLANLNSMTMDDVLKLQAKLEAAGERGRLAAGFSVCSPNDTMAAVIGSMMRTRSAIGVVVNDEQKYVGTTSVRAIVSCFFDA